MDNTSTMKRPSHVNVNNDKANGTTKETKVTNKVGENTFEIVSNNGEMPQAMNRAQRRAMVKREKKIQSKQKKRIIDYIRKHPEAVKIELDEEKIAEIEEQEETPVGKRVEMNPIDEACDIEHVCDIDPVSVSETEEVQEVIEEVTNEVNKFGFTPVPKTNVIDADFKEIKE